MANVTLLRRKSDGKPTKYFPPDDGKDCKCCPPCDGPIEIKIVFECRDPGHHCPCASFSFSTDMGGSASATWEPTCGDGDPATLNASLPASQDVITITINCTSPDGCWGGGQDCHSGVIYAVLTLSYKGKDFYTFEVSGLGPGSNQSPYTWPVNARELCREYFKD